ncbi:LpqB family beta-propeller domain-containing protein [Microterricola viridarii]|uniref:Sporulation and spore germination n=1 Tax=Microterricola viridarii TaxID=412690 RepID=A0A1H1R2P3_9MICO|nr:LpqB family beta-propeller domain-containing protein [Microterricola viridarii]SDS30037.1 Sporulation and spore germination [Microterricola viridarii]
MRNRSRLAAVAALLALALAGCAGIPSSGGVHAGRGVENEVSPEFDFLARSPQPGATQEEILLGFVEAAASPHDRYAVAKEYLTPEFSAEWDPDSSALIDSGTLRSTQPQGADSIALTVSALADVSATGDFVQREEPTTQVLGYEFSRVGEQWRISSAPQGILVDQPTFALVFGSYPLYFFDPTFSYLVPDLRWFPRRTSTPTVIVKALLSGPSDWLADAVQSAFPEGTALASDSVRIVARDAIVDLSPGVLQTEAVQLSRMRLQLRESLRNVSAISGVAITVDQIEQQIPEVPGTVITDPHVDPRALILRDGQIGYLATTGDTITPLEQSAQITALNPTAVNLGVRQQSGDTAAVLSADGVHVARAGSDARLLDDRAGLIAPAVDVFGYVWSVPADAPGELLAFAPDGSEHVVGTSWPDATQITSIALSRDGTRLLALYRAGDATRLVAAAVQRRDGEGRNAPLKLGIPLELAIPAETPLGTAWVNELTVATLTRGEGEETLITTQQLGGPSSEIEGSPGATTLSGGNATRELRLLTADGVLLQRRGLTWQPRLDGVAVLGVSLGR